MQGTFISLAFLVFCCALTAAEPTAECTVTPIYPGDDWHSEDDNFAVITLTSMHTWRHNLTTSALHDALFQNLMACQRCQGGWRVWDALGIKDFCLAVEHTAYADPLGPISSRHEPRSAGNNSFTNLDWAYVPKANITHWEQGVAPDTNEPWIWFRERIFHGWWPGEGANALCLRYAVASAGGPRGLACTRRHPVRFADLLANGSWPFTEAIRNPRKMDQGTSEGARKCGLTLKWRGAV